MITVAYDGYETRIGDTVFEGQDAPCPRCGNIVEFKHDRFGYYQFDVLTGMEGDHICQQGFLCDDCQKDLRDTLDMFLNWSDC